MNVDIGGTPDSALVPADSNPGRVTVTLGGVGRNIAENLSRLGKRVLMVTAMGEDAHAQQIQHSCRELGIDLSHSLTVPNARTSHLSVPQRRQWRDRGRSERHGHL